MQPHQPRIIEHSDRTWVVECRACRDDALTDLPIGIGLPLPDRLTAQRLAQNHVGHQGDDVAVRAGLK